MGNIELILEFYFPFRVILKTKLSLSAWFPKYPLKIRLNAGFSDFVNIITPFLS
jgi:hypothetical protein